MSQKPVVTDIGPKPNAFDIENATKDNANYRTVAWSGKYLQVTLMSIEPGQSIGLETHPDTDQFLRIDAGRGVCKMGPAKDQLNFEQAVEDGWCITVPAGTWHDVVNTGSEPLRLYAIYAPVHHAAGKVHGTFDDAEKDEESGSYNPFLLSNMEQEQATFFLNVARNEAIKAYDLLVLQSPDGVLENIMELGLLHAQTRVLAGERGCAADSTAPQMDKGDKA